MTKLCILILALSLCIPALKGQADNTDFAKGLQGYTYNLHSVRTSFLKNDAVCSLEDKVFLDPRMEFNQRHSKNEYWADEYKIFEDQELMIFHGADKKSLLSKFEKTKDYFLVLKFGNEWTYHDWYSIIENAQTNLNSSHCEDCNFKKDFYNDNGCRFELYYEIRLKYKEGHEMPVAEIQKPEEYLAFEEILKKEKPEIKENELQVPDITVLDEKSYPILFRVMDNPNEHFPELKDLGIVFKETFDTSGNTRYLLGNCTSKIDARYLLAAIRKKGYDSGRIAQYEKGVFIQYVQ